MTAPVRHREHELCAVYAPRIRAYGLRHLRDAAAAEDLVQQVLFTVLKALREGRIDDPQRLGNYVLGTCRNTVRELRRAEARRRKLADSMVALGPSDGVPPPASPLDRRRLEGCIRRLEARARAIVLATFVEDQPVDAIASALRTTPGNVRVIRHRALARLQACVAGEEGTDG